MVLANNINNSGIREWRQHIWPLGLGKKTLLEQRKITEIANLDVEDHIKIMQGNSGRMSIA